MSDAERLSLVRSAVYWCHEHQRLHYREEYLGPENLEWMRANCPLDAPHSSMPLKSPRSA
jgi:hypothetical protein